MDPKSTEPALEQQLADINGLFDRLYDKADIIDRDARTTFQIMRQELEQQPQILEGPVLLLEILREEHKDRVAFSRLLDEEKRAVRDHQLAMQLAGLTFSDTDIKQSADYEASLYGAPECVSDEQRAMAREHYAAAFECQLTHRAPVNGNQIVEADDIKGNTKAKILSSDVLNKCCACMEVASGKNTLTLDCKPDAHTYCQICLVDMFISALDDTSLFPPRCCGVPIPLDACRLILPKEVFKNFDLKVEELATPNPTYCSNAECSEFIRSKEIKADVGSCLFCKHKTCVRCKGAKHEGLCPSDPHVQLLMDMAKRSRWQRCTKCNNMVELEQGCFHMTCRCRHQFCYLCGIQWKGCTCPQWDEHYLTHPLPTVPIAHHPPVAPPRTARHEHSWQHVNSVNCQECGADYLPFVMRYSGCNVANCWRCINNRR